MTHWLKRLRGAVLTGLTWAIGWGFVGGLMELFVDPHGRIADIWPMVLAIPGFFGGIIFAIVLSTAERGRPFEQLSLARFGAWGALTGALLSGLGVALFGLGTLIIVPVTLLAATSASGSLALARRAGDRSRLGPGDHPERSA